MKVRRIAYALALVVSALAIAKAEDKNPLEKAKVGQWVINKSVASGYTSYSYMWVDKVEGKKLTLMSQMLNPDMKTGMMKANPMPIDLEPKKEEGAKEAPKVAIKDLGTEELEIKGKKMKCKKTEIETEVAGMGKMTTVTWACDEIPLWGTAKSVTKDKDGKEISVQECVDFGNEGAKEKPVGAPGGGGGEEPKKEGGMGGEGGEGGGGGGQ